MKVTLREKKLLHGRRSLYLDFYPPIIVDGEKTRREFLSLYVYAKPKNDLEREENKETRILADSLRSKRQLELQANPHGYISARQKKGDFLAFLREMVEEKQKRSRSILSHWNATSRYLEDFTSNSCTFAQVDREFIRKFRDFLLTCLPHKISKSRLRENSRSKSEKRKLSANSVKHYFGCFCSAVKQAQRQNYISAAVVNDTDPIKVAAPKREFLSLDELRSLAQTPCDIPEDFRRAALFSALTGLRHSDVIGLTWANVGRNETGGDYLDFKIRKTGEQTILPISDEARELLGERAKNAEKVFPGMKYESSTNRNLEKWTQAAGIMRRITFHALRRTFATAQITLGTDLYTVSKLLGHSDVSQTQIYAHLVDEKKREAANKITLK